MIRWIQLLGGEKSRTEAEGIYLEMANSNFTAMALCLYAVVASWTAAVLGNSYFQSCPSTEVRQMVFLLVAECLAGERTFAVVDDV